MLRDKVLLEIVLEAKTNFQFKIIQFKDGRVSKDYIADERKKYTEWQKDFFFCLWIKLETGRHVCVSRRLSLLMNGETGLEFIDFHYGMSEFI